MTVGFSSIGWGAGAYLLHRVFLLLPVEQINVVVAYLDALIGFADGYCFLNYDIV